MPLRDNLSKDYHLLLVGTAVLLADVMKITDAKYCYRQVYLAYLLILAAPYAITVYEVDTVPLGLNL